jgi:hypothetical protein
MWIVERSRVVSVRGRWWGAWFRIQLPARWERPCWILDGSGFFLAMPGLHVDIRPLGVRVAFR